MDNLTLKEYYNKKSELFDEVSATYESTIPYKKYFYTSRFQKIIKALDPKSGEKVLDLGCGSGVYSKYIVEKGGLLTAVDLSKGYLVRTKNIVGMAKSAVFVEADAENLPLLGNSFDKALCTEVIEHTQSPEKAIEELARVLKPGGYLVISTPSKYSPMNVAYSLKRIVRRFTFNEHLHEYTPNGLIDILRSRFEVERILFSNFLFPYPLDKIASVAFTPRSIKQLKRVEDIFSRNRVLKYLGWTVIVVAKKKI